MDPCGVDVVIVACNYALSAYLPCGSMNSVLQTI